MSRPPRRHVLRAGNTQHGVGGAPGHVDHHVSHSDSDRRAAGRRRHTRSSLLADTYRVLYLFIIIIIFFIVQLRKKIIKGKYIGAVRYVQEATLSINSDLFQATLRHRT